MSEPMAPGKLAELVRAQIVKALQTPGVRSIVHEALAQEMLTGVPADPEHVAKQIYEYVKARLLNEKQRP